MPPPPRWPASSAPSRATRRTRSTCCGSSATIARPPTASDGYEDLSVIAGAARCHALPDKAWSSASRPGTGPGTGRASTAYRNAQATVIAPTGTIGLVMDCDTTGIEPDFALVKFKKLAGGGYFKIINRTVPEPAHLGYAEIRSTRSSLCRRPRHADERTGRSITSRCRPKASPRALEPSRSAGQAFDIKFVFNRWTLGESSARECWASPTSSSTIRASTCSSALGFTRTTSSRQHLLLRRHDA